MLDCTDIALVEELIRQRTDVAASPGYIWSGKGSIPDGSYLDSQGLPSSLVGLPVQTAKGKVRIVFYDCENISTFDIVLFKFPSPFTTLATISVVASKSDVIILPSPPSVTNDDRLGMRIINGSVRNINAGCLIVGSLT